MVTLARQCTSHYQTSRSRHGLIIFRVIGSSPEKDPSGGRQEVELTPPPEISETKKAEIAKAVEWVSPPDDQAVKPLLTPSVGVQSLSSRETGL